jgi:hypothetical protein
MPVSKNEMQRRMQEFNKTHPVACERHKLRQ